MATKYADEIAGAIEAIAEAGEACTLVTYATQVADPDKPWNRTDDAETEQAIVAVFLNFNIQSSGQTYFEGSLVQQADKKLLVAGDAGIAPGMRCAVRRADGTLWRVANVKTIDPDGTPILFIMQARR